MTPALAAGEAPRLLHGEPVGVGAQHLLALVGSSGGFLAVFTDARHGSPEPFVRRLAPGADPLAAEEPLQVRPQAAREQHLAAAIGPLGHGVVVWELEREPLGAGALHLRTLGPTGELARSDDVIHSKRGWVTSIEEPARGASEPLRAAATVDAAGGVSLAWVHHGHVLAQDPAGRLERVDPEGPLATGPVRLVAGEARPRLLAWPVDGGVRAAGTGPRASRPFDAGPGRLLGAAPDPLLPARSWLLVELPSEDPFGATWDDRAAGGALVLRSVDLERRDALGPDRVLHERAPGRVELASWKPGLALLVHEVGERGTSGTLRLELFALPVDPADAGHGERSRDKDQAHAPWTPVRTLVVPPSGWGDSALEAMLATADDSLLVAYTAVRDSAQRVLVRRLAAGGQDLEPEHPLAAIEASSDQHRPAAASVAGSRAVAVFEDASGGTPALRAVVVSAAGDPQGAEFPVPAPTPEAPDASRAGSTPMVSMGPAGDFLVAWDAGGRWLGQAFHPDATPKRPAGVLVRDVETGRGRALTRQESYRSWLAAWCTPAGLFVQRIRGDGEPLAEPLSIVGAGQGARPALLELFDERVVVAWQQPAAKGTTLRLRLLEPELQAASEVLEPPLPPAGSSAGPLLARAPRGGFLMAYEVTLGLGKLRYAAQRFGSDGEAIGGPIALGSGDEPTAGLALARLSDQSWAFAWELRSAAGQRLCVQRLLPDAPGPGPVRLLDPEASGRRVAPEGPVLVPVAEGLLGLWVDTRLGAGRDVWLRHLPLAFDR